MVEVSIPLPPPPSPLRPTHWSGIYLGFRDRFECNFVVLSTQDSFITMVLSLDLRDKGPVLLKSSFRAC